MKNMGYLLGAVWLFSRRASFPVRPLSCWHQGGRASGTAGARYRRQWETSVNYTPRANHYSSDVVSAGLETSQNQGAVRESNAAVADHQYLSHLRFVGDRAAIVEPGRCGSGENKEGLQKKAIRLFRSKF